MSDTSVPGAKPNRHSRRAAKVVAEHAVDVPSVDPVVPAPRVKRIKPAILAASVPELPASPVEPEPEMPAEPIVPEPEAAVEHAPEAIPEPAPEIIVEPAPEPRITTPVAAVAAPIEAKEETIMTEEFNTAAATAETVFAKVQGGAKEAVAKGQALVADAADFGKGNVEAMMESGRISARGFETLAQDNAAYTKSSFETATATIKSAATVQSPVELFKLQGDFMRSAFDSWVAQASKNTEAMLKLANDAAQPLSSRVALAAEKIKLAA